MSQLLENIWCLVCKNCMKNFEQEQIQYSDTVGSIKVKHSYEKQMMFCLIPTVCSWIFRGSRLILFQYFLLKLLVAPSLRDVVYGA